MKALRKVGLGKIRLSSLQHRAGRGREKLGTRAKTQALAPSLPPTSYLGVGLFSSKIEKGFSPACFSLNTKSFEKSWGSAGYCISLLEMGGLWVFAVKKKLLAFFKFRISPSIDGWVGVGSSEHRFLSPSENSVLLPGATLSETLSLQVHCGFWCPRFPLKLKCC